MRLKTYLFSHECQTLNDLAFAAGLNASPRVANWGRFLQTAWLVVTDMTPEELAAFVKELLPPAARFVVVDTAAGHNGWLHREAWDMMRHPGPPADPPAPAKPPPPIRYGP